MSLIIYPATAVILFFIGMYILVISPHLIKKIIGVNIMETAIFLFLISTGSTSGAIPPILPFSGSGPYAHPLPQFMVIMGVIITLGITTFGLILAVKIFQTHNTLNVKKLRQLDHSHR